MTPEQLTAYRDLLASAKFRDNDPNYIKYDFPKQFNAGIEHAERKLKEVLGELAGQEGER